MIALFLLSLVLIAIAVALMARGAMVSRFRTVDTLAHTASADTCKALKSRSQSTCRITHRIRLGQLAFPMIIATCAPVGSMRLSGSPDDGAL